MKIDYFMIAESANQSTTPSQNILGAGSRVIEVPTVPILHPMAIVGAVSGSPAEAGSYPMAVHLKDPGKRKRELIATLSTLERRKFEVDPTVPIGFMFHILFPLEIAREGLYVVQLQVGKLRAEHRFQVRVKPPGEPD